MRGSESSALVAGLRGGGAMITVRLPATLRENLPAILEIAEPVATIAELVAALDVRQPGLLEQLDDSVFSFAVNGEMLLHHAQERLLSDADEVEVIPTISGG